MARNQLRLAKMQWMRELSKILTTYLCCWDRQLKYASFFVVVCTQ